MKAEIINPFIKAAINVIEKMAFIRPESGKPYLKKGDVATGDISSIIGLTGNPCGTVSISFDAGSILMIVSSMFGEKLQAINNEVADAVGELSNMISGQARRELEERGYLLEGAIPSVFTGPNHEIKHITDGPQIAVPFNVEKGTFTMEVCFENDSELVDN